MPPIPRHEMGQDITTEARTRRAKEARGHGTVESETPDAEVEEGGQCTCGGGRVG